MTYDAVFISSEDCQPHEILIASKTSMLLLPKAIPMIHIFMYTLFCIPCIISTADHDRFYFTALGT